MTLIGCGSPDVDEPARRQASALTSCDVDVPGYVDYWISPSGAGEAHSLTELHASLPATLTSHIYVHVRGGVYHDSRLDWTKLNPNRNIVIEGCPGEDAVFDGTIDDDGKASRLIALEPSVSGNTNVTFRNLTIRNYLGYGIILNGAEADWKDGCDRLSTGNNTIENCSFEKIGNAGVAGSDAGWGAIGITQSRGNIIANNSFVHIENVLNRTLIHGIYAAHCATGNTIVGNSFAQVSGDPIKFRNKSNDNQVQNNYFDRAGANSVINVDYQEATTACTNACPDAPADVEKCEDDDDDTICKCPFGCEDGREGDSIEILAEGNVATFPHKGSEGPLILCRVNSQACTTQVSFVDNVFELGTPDSEKVSAITAADFDQDGVDEVVVAFNYDGAYSGFTKVVSTGGSLKNRHLHRVLYTNAGSGAGYWDVAALTSGDFNNDDIPELLTAFHAGAQTAVYRGNGVAHLSGTTSAGQIYSDTSGSLWRVRAMAAADFDENAGDAVITTFEKPNNTAVYLGNGSTSLTSGGTLFTDSSSPYWRITAMSSGDFDSDDNYEVITAMHHVDPSAAYKIYSGNGETSIANVSLNTDTAAPFWETTATVGADFNKDGADEVVTGMFIANNTFKLYRGNGTSSVSNVSLRSSSSAFYVRALGAADMNGDGDLELISAIEDVNPNRDDLRILIGNGYTDYDDVGELYSSYFND